MTYTGSDNPKKYNGDDDYSYRPSVYDRPGYIHDLAYRDLQVSGLNGLFNEKRAIKAYLLGQGLGLIALPKTIETFLPTMVNPPSK